MKKLFLNLFLIFYMMGAASAAPQVGITLKGKVLDKANSEPVAWATVALMAADSTIVAGTSCDEQGNYSLSPKSAGNYTLTVKLIGYKDHSQPVSLTSSTEIEPVLMEADAQMLSAAGVTEKVKLIEIKLDKVVMNVSESAFAQSSTALDLIKKAPGVTIDKDGNVKLNGKTVNVWIDGRPSYMDGKSLESLLRSTEGGSIDKFEIMEHPSSKYDAAGQGGIINIKTKRNLMKGLSGSVGLGGGGMYFKAIDDFPWEQSLRANVAYRTGKTNTYFNISDGIYNTPIYLENNLTIEPTAFFQSGKTNYDTMYHNYNVKIGNDWFINDKNTLGVIVSVPGSYMKMYSTKSTTEQYLGDELQKKTSSQIKNGPSKNVQHSANLNYTHIFDAERNAEITGNLDYYHNSTGNLNIQNDTTEAVIEQKTMKSDQYYNIYSAKADYQTLLWKKFMLESGAKWAYARTNNYGIETQTGVRDNPTDFIYAENIGAVYATFAGQLGPKWSIKAGLRGEYTNSFGDWTSDGTTTRREYFDLFPTVYAGFNPSEKWRLGLSYTRRIERPRYGQMNPTKMYVDAKTYTVGNPDLLPQYSNEVGFNVGFGQHLSLSLQYNHAYNVINQMPAYNLLDGTQYLIWGNIGKQNMGIASFSVAALPITKWWQWTLNLAGIYINNVSSISDIVRNSFSVNGYTEFSFILPKDWKIELDAFFMTPMTYGSFRIHGNWNSNFALKKGFLDNKLTLTLRLDDIFRTSKENIDVLDETGMGATTTLKQIYYAQKVIFDLSWNFGKAQSPMRHRKVGDIEESSRIGGGSGIGGSK